MFFHWRHILDFLGATYNLVLNGIESEIVHLLSRRSLKESEFRRGRLGLYDDLVSAAGQPRVWCHAVSVGEVTGAAPTIAGLRRRLPGAAVFMTSGTPQGVKFARAQLPQEIVVLPFPLDFSKCVVRAISTIQPDIFVNFETEFWPNFLRELRKRNIPSLLLNGRISSSSERFYRLFSPLFRPVFEQFTFMAMHSLEDMERALRLGALPERVMALGSSKYDGLTGRANREKAAYWKKLLEIKNEPVIVGGSLRGSETIELMQVFVQLRRYSPELLAVFAPRHMKNIPKMCDWLTKKEVRYDLLTDIEGGFRTRSAPVVLVDRIGVLSDLYSAGDLIFCGGTFEPVGGHNIMEPAAWSKAVFYGPSLKKVLHEHRILHDFGGSFMVSGPEELFSNWKEWLGRMKGLEKVGESAFRALNSFKGVVARQVDLILQSLPKEGLGWSG
jgi:3-deoxy-D-manno-octulosonic-acid transferase